MKIDLGRKDEMPKRCEAAEKPSEPRINYPTIYLSDIPGIENIPTSGSATITFEVVERSARKTIRDGKEETRVSMDLKLKSIEIAKGKGKKGDGLPGADAAFAQFVKDLETEGGAGDEEDDEDV